MPNSYFILSSANNVSQDKRLFGEGSTCVIEQTWENDRRVFVKRLKPEFRGQEIYEAAFRKEFEIGSRLDSPYLPQYIRMDEEGNIYEEFVDGMSLDRFVKDNPAYFLSEKNLWRFLSELLQGLSYLHARQILHLDLKPQNVMLTRVGNNVKIIDLGFAYSDSFITSVGATREFAAPEFLDGSTLPDTFMDVYSVGCLMRYISDSVGEPLPNLFRRIQERCMERDPSMRYQTANEILEVLGKESRSHVHKPLLTRKRVAMAVIGLIAVLAVFAMSLMSAPPESFPFSKHLICRTISSDSLTVEITHDTTVAFNLKDGEMDITIPDTITMDGYSFTVVQIDSFAFYGCEPLVAIVLPQTLRSIGNHAFEECDSLTHINIPDNVTHIGDYALRGCALLRSVRLPQNLEVLNEGVFSRDTLLKEIEVPQKVRELRRDAFGDCFSLESVTLPEGLEVIGRGVFWRCRSLRTITIPSTVTRFGDFVFWGCTSLTDVYMLNPEPPRITDIFSNLHLRIHVPSASVEKYRSQQYWKDHEIVSM